MCDILPPEILDVYSLFLENADSSKHKRPSEGYK
jgi:hypothetical protein